MKKLISFCLVLMISDAYAATFQENTALPVELQAKVLEEIKAKVPCAQMYSLKEIETTETLDAIDQGVIDQYFTTTLKGTYYYDTYHPAPMLIEISSVKYAGSNPTVEHHFITGSNLENFQCEDLF